MQTLVKSMSTLHLVIITGGVGLRGGWAGLVGRPAVGDGDLVGEVFCRGGGMGGDGKGMRG